jgi:hypothetical protein
MARADDVANVAKGVIELADQLFAFRDAVLSVWPRLSESAPSAPVSDPEGAPDASTRVGSRVEQG